MNDWLNECCGRYINDNDNDYREDDDSADTPTHTHFHDQLRQADVM